MSIQTRTTELEAVNVILNTIGESPISSLSGSLPVDATVAKNILSEINREVQSAGWHFNTGYNVTLNRDTNNKIPIATNVVRIELDPYIHNKANLNIVQRGSYLYNIATNTDVFSDDIKNTKIVYLLSFEDIPEQCKRYITIRAARIFHDRTLGANALHKFSQEDERQALSLLRQAEAETGKYSIFETPEQAYVISRFR